METTVRSTLGMLAVAASVCLLTFVVSNRSGDPAHEDFKVPDDIRVAREELSRKFAGPGYFHFIRPDGPHLGYPYIQASDARAQVSGIVTCRSLPPDAVAGIQEAIERLVIPAASRVAGADQVNFLQLNLVLDELHQGE